MLSTNTMEIESKLTAWLTENDPVLFENNIQNQVQVNAPIMAATPEQSTNIAVSSAAVVGDCDYKNIDAAIKSKINNNRPEAMKIFKESPISGCTTILDMARVASGYDPNGGMNRANKENYKEYLKKVLACPLFHLKIDTCDTYNRNEKSWNEAINQIVNLFTGVTTNDREKIEQTIKNLVNAVTSNYNTKQGASIFSVSVLDADENHVEAYIYYSDILMCEDKKKGSDCKQSTLNIFKTYLEFRSDLWPIYAEKIFDKHYKAVDDWLDDNSTKQGDIKANLCIGGYKEV